MFQFENHVKPDYCNAQGLEELDEQEGEWYEWCNEDGEDIKEFWGKLKGSKGENQKDG